MATHKLTITLTADQQKQIRDATGRSVSELRIGLAAPGELSEKDLDQVSGGAIDSYMYFLDYSGPKAP